MGVSLLVNCSKQPKTNLAWSANQRFSSPQTDDVQLLSPGTTLGSTPLPDAAKTIPSDTNRLIIWSTLPQGLTKLTKAALPDSLGKMTLAENESQMSDTASGDKSLCPPPSMLIQAFADILTDPATMHNDLLTQTTYIDGKVDQMINEFLKANEDFKDKYFRIPLVTSTLTELVYLGP